MSAVLSFPTKILLDEDTSPALAEAFPAEYEVYSHQLLDSPDYPDPALAARIYDTLSKGGTIDDFMDQNLGIPKSDVVEALDEIIFEATVGEGVVISVGHSIKYNYPKLRRHSHQVSRWHWDPLTLRLTSTGEVSTLGVFSGEEEVSVDLSGWDAIFTTLDPTFFRFDKNGCDIYEDRELTLETLRVLNRVRVAARNGELSQAERATASHLLLRIWMLLQENIQYPETKLLIKTPEGAAKEFHRENSATDPANSASRGEYAQLADNEIRIGISALAPDGGRKHYSWAWNRASRRLRPMNRPAEDMFFNHSESSEQPPAVFEACRRIDANFMSHIPASEITYRGPKALPVLRALHAEISRATSLDWFRPDEREKLTQSAGFHFFCLVYGDPKSDSPTGLTDIDLLEVIESIEESEHTMKIEVASVVSTNP